MDKTGKRMRITDTELALIKATFADNEPLLLLMRKIFLPELDASTPIGQNIDLWMTVKIDEMTPEEAIINLKARNSLISHLDQQLSVLEILAGQKDETAEETKKRLQTNSAK
jgi:hypothetical protein